MDKREQARKMYEDGLQYKIISETLAIPINTIKSWRKRYKWIRGGATQPSNRGAPKGNKNAVGASGNKHASAPKKNKNAVKTGEYETIFADTLTSEEKAIYSSMDDDPSFILVDEIRILKIRQRRMMQRIKDAEDGLNEDEVQRLQQLRKVKVPISRNGQTAEIKQEVLKDVQVVRKTYRKIDNILALEEALTRVSNALTKAIKQLSDIQLNEYKTKLIGGQVDKVTAEAKIVQHEADKMTNSNAGNDLLKALLDVKSGGDGSGTVEV